MMTRGELEIIKAWANKGCFTPQTVGHLESLIQHAEETIGGEVEGSTDSDIHEIHALIEKHGPLAAEAILKGRERAAKAETLRDRFAMAALPSVAIGMFKEFGFPDAEDSVIAERSYRIADAMLSAREKKEAQ